VTIQEVKQQRYQIFWVQPVQGLWINMDLYIYYGLTWTCTDIVRGLDMTTMITGLWHINTRAGNGKYNLSYWRLHLQRADSILGSEWVWRILTREIRQRIDRRYRRPRQHVCQLFNIHHTIFSISWKQQNERNDTFVTALLMTLHLKIRAVKLTR